MSEHFWVNLRVDDDVGLEKDAHQAETDAIAPLTTQAEPPFRQRIATEIRTNPPGPHLRPCPTVGHNRLTYPRCPETYSST